MTAAIQLRRRREGCALPRGLPLVSRPPRIVAVTGRYRAALMPVPAAGRRERRAWADTRCGPERGPGTPQPGACLGRGGRLADRQFRGGRGPGRGRCRVGLNGFGRGASFTSSRSGWAIIGTGRYAHFTPSCTQTRALRDHRPRSAPSRRATYPASATMTRSRNGPVNSPSATRTVPPRRGSGKRPCPGPAGTVTAPPKRPA
jgi:hypothetical protein